MIKFVLPVLGLLVLTGAVSAYQIDIDAPGNLTVGKPLIVNGTTNFGIGTPIDVVLYRQLTTNTEIKRKIAYVQSDHTFRVVFDTTSLEKGTYKVEVPASGLGDSVNTRIVELVDRTDEISLFPGIQQQEFSGNLTVKGTMEYSRNSGVQVEVTAPDGSRVYGPKYIPTDVLGIFSLQVPIHGPGDYEVSFTDANGYIGTKVLSVTGQAPVTTVQVTPSGLRLSSGTRASRDAPAYFEVKSGPGFMNISTSSGIDWILEYGDDRGVIRTVNENGADSPEKVTVAGNGKSVYVKVYPYHANDSGEVILFVENAQSVRISPTIPVLFQTPEKTAAPSETRAPLPVPVACCSLLAAIVLLQSRKQH